MKRRSVIAGAVFAAGFWAGFIAFIIWDQDHGKNRPAGPGIPTPRQCMDSWDRP